MARGPSLRSLFDDVRTRAARARENVRRARRAVDDAAREVTRSVERLGVAAGIPGVDAGPVIDMGPSPRPLARVTRALAAAVVVGLTVMAMFSFAVFFTELLVAVLIATRVLGLRIDPRVVMGA